MADPLSAGIMVGGNVISGLSQGDQYAPAAPRTYTGLGSAQQVSGLNKLLALLVQGGGDFGSGAAARQANSTLMDQMAQRGIDPQGKFASSAQANMLGQVASQDAARRGNMLMQAISARPWTFNYQNLGTGMEGLGGSAARSTQAMDAMSPQLERMRGAGSHMAGIADQIERQLGSRYRTGGTYRPERVG